MESLRGKKFSQIATIIMAASILSVVPYAISLGLDFTAEFTGLAICQGKICVQQPFNVEIYAEIIPDDLTRLAWSSPFVFYGDGDAETMINPGQIEVNPDFDSPWPPPPYSLAYESWDGDLTNSSGGLTGDLFNFTFTIQISYLISDTGMLWIVSAHFDGIVGDSSSVGDFCIGQGDFVNSTYDWLFDSPVPTFDPVCLPIGWYGICGDANHDRTVNIFDITAIIEYLYLDGPAPDPLESADVNGDMVINIFDITYLVSFLYLDGPEPTCP
jgi:hypothetical protein